MTIRPYYLCVKSVSTKLSSFLNIALSQFISEAGAGIVCSSSLLLGGPLFLVWIKFRIYYLRPVCGSWMMLIVRFAARTVVRSRKRVDPRALWPHRSSRELPKHKVTGERRSSTGPSFSPPCLLLRPPHSLPRTRTNAQCDCPLLTVGLDLYNAICIISRL